MKKIVAMIAAAGIALGGLFAVQQITAESADAYTLADFSPGYIISDTNFFDYNSLSAAGVQAFIASMEPACAGANGFPCLKNYRETTFDRASAGTGHCAAYIGAAGESAGAIIFKVAQACKISPKVLLVTLQKEQGLVTASSPSSIQYRAAMGYGCPDTAACDARYYGFYNQVYNAAWQFRQYTNFPSRTYKIGPVAIAYKPGTNCPAPVVNIINQATANLYNYTPYQPDIFAMQNLRGTGGPCSSYGNRNFWVYYSDWFGSPTGKINPIGSLDVTSIAPGTVHLGGWTFDPDAAGSISIQVTLNGVVSTSVADRPRPDVAAAFTLPSSAHGFDVTIPVTAGVQTVCAIALNQGPGTDTPLGCRTLQAPGGPPVGAVDSLRLVPGTATLSGWAFDPDVLTPITVAVYVDDVGINITADGSRPDVGTAYGYGANHGFATSVPVPGGTHRICAYGINVGIGANQALTCTTVTMPTGSPLGALDSAVVAPGSVTVSGWTLDPDTVSSIPVHVYVDAVGVAATANTSRADIASLFKGYGDLHGYTTTVALPSGRHTVCAYGINIAGSGANQVLGCRTVVALSGSPIGALDSVTATGGVVTASGWAFDPDTVSPIGIRISVDGVDTTVTANASRPDVASLYPVYGAQHGFSGSVPGAAAGTHQVCVFAVNTGAGSDAPLGCRSVVV